MLRSSTGMRVDLPAPDAVGHQRVDPLLRAPPRPRTSATVNGSGATDSDRSTSPIPIAFISAS